MQALISNTSVAPGLWIIQDPLGDVCYLVEGRERAALIDTMSGFGDLAAYVRGLIGDKPLQVLLTHRHIDHVGGAYWFGEAWMSAEDADCWGHCEAHAGEMAAHAEGDGLVSAGCELGPRDGARPRVRELREGDVIDLGGRSLEVVALPGHTAGSIGFLCRELGDLFSGDAVTPVMCLCFPESLGLDAWRSTLRKMEGLDFERFRTGHHVRPFPKGDLASFEAAADFVEAGGRGYEWSHGFISGWEGTIHLCPCGTYDVDSADFRAVIMPREA